jgi:hypothetical protein
MQNTAIPPVLKSIRVSATPARAFDLFTAGFHQWWPRAHSLNAKVERVAISPAFETEVEIRFEALGENATQVTLEHRHLERYGLHAEKVRGGLDSPDGWMGGLRLYAAVLAGGPPV